MENSQIDSIRKFRQLTEKKEVGEKFTLWGCQLFLIISSRVVTGVSGEPVAVEFTKNIDGHAMSDNVTDEYLGHWTETRSENMACIANFLKEAKAEYQNMLNGCLRDLERRKLTLAHMKDQPTAACIRMEAELFLANNLIQVVNQNVETLSKLIAVYEA